MNTVWIIEDYNSGDYVACHKSESMVNYMHEYYRQHFVDWYKDEYSVEDTLERIQMDLDNLSKETPFIEEVLYARKVEFID